MVSIAIESALVTPPRQLDRRDTSHPHFAYSSVAKDAPPPQGVMPSHEHSKTPVTGPLLGEQDDLSFEPQNTSMHQET